jgi:hypothetical protein
MAGDTTRSAARERPNRSLHHPARHLVRREFHGHGARPPDDRGLSQFRPDVAAFMAECAGLGTSEAEIEQAEKIGFDLGVRVKHPFDPAGKCPVYPPTSCCPPMARARSSAHRPATSAISISPTNTDCLSFKPVVSRPAPMISHVDHRGLHR